MPGMHRGRGRTLLSGARAAPSHRVWTGARAHGGSPRSGPAFRSRTFFTTNGYIEGITKDSTGAALGGCVVQAFRTFDDSYCGEVTSDGSGIYSIVVPPGGYFYIVAYKAGSPDVAGTTTNTLTPNAQR